MSGHRGAYDHRPPTSNTAANTGAVHTPQPTTTPPPGQGPLPAAGSPPTSPERREPTTTVKHMPKTLNTHHVADNYQVPREGNHTRRGAPTRRLRAGTIDWKKILPGLTTVDTIHLIAIKKRKRSASRAPLHHHLRHGHQ